MHGELVLPAVDMLGIDRRQVLSTIVAFVSSGLSRDIADRTISD